MLQAELSGQNGGGLSLLSFMVNTALGTSERAGMVLSADGRLKTLATRSRLQMNSFVVGSDDSSLFERSYYSNVTIHTLHSSATELICILGHNGLGVSDLLGLRPARAACGHTVSVSTLAPQLS